MLQLPMAFQALDVNGPTGDPGTQRGFPTGAGALSSAGCSRASFNLTTSPMRLSNRLRRIVISLAAVEVLGGGGSWGGCHRNPSLGDCPTRFCFNCLCSPPATSTFCLPRTSSTAPHRTCRRCHHRAYTRTIWVRLRILRDGHIRIDHRVGLR